MSNKRLNAALVGIGGFGKSHVKAMHQLWQEGLLTCAAFCDPSADRFPEQKELLESMGAKHYSNYEEMLRQPGLDFIAVATPIPLHKSMCIKAMESGVPVLLEKPPAVAIQDLDAMLEVQRRTGQLVAVDFQNTSGTAFRRLLQNIRDGVIGELQTVTAVGMWKRTQAYYDRTYWAGALRSNGEYVLDGSIFNALSHLLNNALIAAGAGDPQHAEPVWVQAELYKGHEIESEDTSCIRVAARNGVLIHYYSTLCSDHNETPYIRVKGTAGEIVWSYDHKLVYTDASGQTRTEALANEDLMRNMYTNLMDVILGRRTDLYCSLADCRSFTLAANGAFTSTGIIHPIPKDHLIIQEEADTIATGIRNLKAIFAEASAQGKLFSELPVQWASITEKIEMSDYRRLRLRMLENPAK